MKTLRDISLKAEHILDMDETEERYLYGPPIKKAP